MIEISKHKIVPEANVGDALLSQEPPCIVITSGIRDLVCTITDRTTMGGNVEVEIQEGYGWAGISGKGEEHVG